jgi:hypothetical protein
MPRLGFDEFLTAEAEFAYRPAGGRPGTYLFFYPSAEKYCGPVCDQLHIQPATRQPAPC